MSSPPGNDDEAKTHEQSAGRKRRYLSSDDGPSESSSRRTSPSQQAFIQSDTDAETSKHPHISSSSENDASQVTFSTQASELPSTPSQSSFVGDSSRPAQLQHAGRASESETSSLAQQAIHQIQFPPAAAPNVLGLSQYPVAANMPLPNVWASAHSPSVGVAEAMAAAATNAFHLNMLQQVLSTQQALAQQGGPNVSLMQQQALAQQSGPNASLMQQALAQQGSSNTLLIQQQALAQLGGPNASLMQQHQFVNPLLASANPFGGQLFYQQFLNNMAGLGDPQMQAAASMPGFISNSTLSFPSGSNEAGNSSGLARSMATSSAITSFAGGKAPDDNRPGGLLLYMPSDDDLLSDHQILVRKQIEFFAAQSDDVNVVMPGRRKEIFLGQVGIRCRHCVGVSVHQRTRGSVYYPAKLKGLYQAAQNMAASHLCVSCENIDPYLKAELRAYQTAKSSSGHGGKQYWADTAGVLGVIQTEEGLRFDIRKGKGSRKRDKS